MLVVLGLGVIASMMGIFNFAHGEFVLLGAYTTYLLTERAAGLARHGRGALRLALIGFVIERLVIRRFYAVPIVAMLGTYALGLVIRETVRGLIGGLYISCRSRSSARSPRRHAFSKWRVAIIVITALVMAASSCC